MNQPMLRIVAFSLAVTAYQAVLAVRTTLSFDDLSDTTTWSSTSMPQGYGGLNWIGWRYYSWDNPPYNPASGTTRLLNHAATPNAVLRDTPFTFFGAKFAGYESQSSPRGVMFTLIRNGAIVHQTPYLWLTATPTFLDGGYDGLVDRVEVRGDSAFGVMDDFAFDPVPEPATLFTLGAGVATIVCRRWSTRGQ